MDVGYNKPFKTHIYTDCEEYMINNMPKNGYILSPLREEVSHWISEAYWSLEGSPIVKNVWLKLVIVMIQPVTGSVTVSEPHNIVATQSNTQPK